MQGPVLPTVGGYQAFFQENGTQILTLWASLQGEQEGLAAEVMEATPLPLETKAKGKVKGQAPPGASSGGERHDQFALIYQWWILQLSQPF